MVLKQLASIFQIDGGSYAMLKVLRCHPKGSIKTPNVIA